MSASATFAFSPPEAGIRCSIPGSSMSASISATAWRPVLAEFLQTQAKGDIFGDREVGKKRVMLKPS